MFRIRFYNDLGCVNFGGGGSDNLWRLTAIDGLTLPQKSFITAKYENVPGQHTIRTDINARTITLSGDIRRTSNFFEVYENALRVFAHDGILEINTFSGLRKIEAHPVSFTQGERNGAYQLFCVQFICDYPYFESGSASEIIFFKSIGLLSSEFTFPGMFSRRISRSNMYYAGSAETEPTFFISTGSAQGSFLEIINHTSGERLKFNYETLPDEFITVDIVNRNIFNSDGESLLKYIADDSFFDGLHLYPGINDIEVRLGEPDSELEVRCRYTEKFAEAVC